MILFRIGQKIGVFLLALFKLSFNVYLSVSHLPDIALGAGSTVVNRTDRQGWDWVEASEAFASGTEFKGAPETQHLR